jgi:hypothetical protein
MSYAFGRLTKDYQMPATFIEANWETKPSHKVQQTSFQGLCKIC